MSPDQPPPSPSPDEAPVQTDNGTRPEDGEQDVSQSADVSYLPEDLEDEQ